MQIVVAVLAILSTLCGGLFAIRFKDKLHLILGFSAGAVLAVALFDLLPESINLAGASYSLSTLMLLVAGGFSFYLMIDRLFSLHSHEDCENPRHHKSNFGAYALIVHSLLDGIAIGLAFKISPSVGWAVTLAVLAHDFSDGINTVGIIFKSKVENSKATYYLIADAIAPAIGILATLFFTISEPTLGLVLAVFAGFFLYLGASDLIPESHHEHPTIWTTIATFIGLAVLYVVIRIAG